MYDFAVEDCLHHPTCKKRFYRRFEKDSESEDVSPHKIAFELGLIKRNLVPWVCPQL